MSKAILQGKHRTPLNESAVNQVAWPRTGRCPREVSALSLRSHGGARTMGQLLCAQHQPGTVQQTMAMVKWPCMLSTPWTHLDVTIAQTNSPTSPVLFCLVFPQPQAWLSFLAWL